ncbi:MAG: hypothetical protein AAGA85_11180 [Bacteroidota bacterium]
MRSVIYSFFVLLAFLSLWGCEECEECERVASAPFTNLVFINNTLFEDVVESIDLVEEEVDTLGAQVTLLEQEVTALREDSTRFSQSISEGETGLEDSLALTIEALTIAEVDLSEKAEQLSAEEAELDSLSEIQTTIESGAVVVSRIRNLRNGLEITNSDTLTSYQVPLEVEVDETNYELEIEGTTYDLTILYERAQTLNVERVLSITASSLFATSSNFEEVDVLCPETNPDCTSGETIIGCFF